MAFNFVAPSLEMRDLAVNGEVIETVDNFIYLGANFTNDCNDSKEIRRRLAIARSAVVSLSNIWKDRSITLQSKIRILHLLVFPVATYGCECWVLKKCDRNRLTSFEIWCYRRIMRISWRERKKRMGPGKDRPSNPHKQHQQKEVIFYWPCCEK